MVRLGRPAARRARPARATPCRAICGLAAGGTAVGTGINAPEGFGEAVAAKLAELTGLPFVTAPNKFAAQASPGRHGRASARALRGVAVALMKIANDMRWLASGPRAGFGELRLPANEPGSSIMPGKVNPTQCGGDAHGLPPGDRRGHAVAVARRQGNFELNTCARSSSTTCCTRPASSATPAEKLKEYCVAGTELDRAKIAEHVDRSLMLVTALSPHIGYDKATAIAHKADEEDSTLRDAALALGVSAADFDRIVDPATMVGNPRRDLGLA